jgi:Right handed beta helix region
MVCRGLRVVALVVFFAGGMLAVPLASVAGASPATIHVPADQPTIQAGINAANAGDTVLVSPGSYVEHIDFNGKSITVRSASGAASTTIDGGQTDTVVRFDHGESRSSVLRGFTIQNGNAYAGGNYDGGGLYVGGASPTIEGNVIVNNSACDGGGGIYVHSGGPKIAGNRISLNRQSGCSGGVGGGGIALLVATGAEISGNTITQNSWGSSGGAITMFAAGSPTITNNVISGNSPGALWIVNDSPATIVQNLIASNPGGPGIDVLTPSGSTGPAFVNNTVVAGTGTVAVLAGGFDSTTTFFNNVFASVTPGQPAVNCDTTYSATPPSFSTNDAWAGGGTAMTGSCSTTVGTQGNIAADPKFVSSSDFHIAAPSPVIDSGTNSAPYVGAKDLDGRPRIVDGDGNGSAVIDMGVYEFAAALRVQPASGPAGTFVNMQASGFRPGEQVTLVYATGVSPPTATVCSATASSKGVAKCAGNIPSGGAAGSPGAHGMRAVGGTSGVIAPATFTLTA